MSFGSMSPSDDPLWIITGYPAAQIIHVAVQLRLPDRLAGGPRTVDDLAAATGTHPPSLARLARALASLGLLVEVEDGRVALTDAGTRLRADVPGSMRDTVLFITGEWFWRAWGGLLESVRTGEPAFDREFGMSNFAYWEYDPSAGAMHDAFFQSMAGASNSAILAAYDFSRAAAIVDVGGNRGALLAAILHANPTARGVLFDLPHVVAGVASVLAGAGVSERCEVIGGDFFTAVPAGGDIYLMKQIIHDWDDEQSLAILRRCRAAMRPGAVLLLVEQVLPERMEAGAAAQRVARVDLQMLIMTHGGRERTAGQYRALLAGAGFDPREVLPTGSQFSIIEGVAR